MYLFALPPFGMAVSALSLFAVSLFALSLIAPTLCRFDHKGVGQRILLQKLLRSLVLVAVNNRMADLYNGGTEMRRNKLGG